MLIRAEAEFLLNQRLMHETTLTLLQLGLITRGKESCLRRSVIENWIKIAEVIQTKPTFPAGISAIPLSTLCAYYLSQKLTEFAPTAGRRSQFEFFAEITEMLKKHPPEEHELLGAELHDYLCKLYPEYLLSEVNALLDTLMPGIKLLNETYAPIKGLVRSVKSWEPPNKEKGLPEEHLCDYIDESVPIRSMAHVLEHIIKETRRKVGNPHQKITIEDIQNELVHTGLNFGEKSHPHFAWGALFALPQLFDFEKERVLAWYFVDKIAKSLQNKFYAESYAEGTNTLDTNAHNEIQEQLKLINQDFKEIYAIISLHKGNLKNPAFYKDCAKFLNSIKRARGFNEKQIFSWSRGLRDLVTLYEVCAKPLAQNQPEERVLKLLVVGDSVSAGLRVPHRRKDERWVAQLQRLLVEAGLPIKVINCSISGFETAEGLEALPQYLKFFKPDMVVCPLGGNDAREGRDLFKVLENMEGFVRICTEHNIQAEHVVWGAGIPKTFPVCKGYRNSFLGLLREFEKRTGAIGAPLPDYILAEKHMDEDRLHFKAEIQKDIADFAYKTVAPIAAVLWEAKKRRLENGTRKMSNSNSDSDSEGVSMSGQRHHRRPSSVVTAFLPHFQAVVTQSTNVGDSPDTTPDNLSDDLSDNSQGSAEEQIEGLEPQQQEQAAGVFPHQHQLR